MTGLCVHVEASLTVVSFPAATYVKVYVLENGVCLAKKKTKVVKKNLDPTYQQALLFDESPQGKVLQVGTTGVIGRSFIPVDHFYTRYTNLTQLSL